MAGLRRKGSQVVNLVVAELPEVTWVGLERRSLDLVLRWYNSMAGVHRKGSRVVKLEVVELLEVT